MTRPPRFVRVVDGRVVARRPGLPVRLDPAQRCPCCHDALGGPAPLVACVSCTAVLHAECAGDGCPTLGCGAPRGIAKDLNAGRRGAAVVGALAALLGVLAWSRGPASPPIVQARPPLVRVEAAPAPTPGGTVTLSGVVEAEGPVLLTVGDLSWTVDPGPFVAALTVAPDQAVVVVRARDGRGREAIAWQRVTARD
ncbi:MAG: hypothetical protein KIT58_09250 [Planctomycetota bacterium]|nr:hypothetical protein [Planctomycetota bacterium]